MSEPTKINAGDTVEFTKSLPDYPASTYDLFYKIIGRNAISAAIEATADGDDFEITIASSVTQNFAKGQYRLVGYVTGASSFQKTIYDAPLEIDTNYAAATAVTDTREFWQKIIDALQAAMQSRASIVQSAMTVPGLTGKTIQYLTLKEQQEALAYAEYKLSQVIANQNQANGRTRPRILTRFGVTT